MTNPNDNFKRVTLGQVMTTANAARVVPTGRMAEVLARHRAADWGDLDADDRAMNDRALASGDDRILSSYKINPLDKSRDAPKVWVITEHDRSVTTILLPEDY